MFEINPTTVKAAAIVRCFVVGFRYFRQPASEQQRIKAVMQAELSLAISGETAFDISIDDTIYETVNAVASAYGYNKYWTVSVLMLAAPFLVKHLIDPSLVKPIVIQTLKNPALLNEADKELYMAAYAGNTKFASALYQVFDETLVFDEDRYFGAESEVPELPELLTYGWLSTLVERRKIQLQKWQAVDAPVVQEETATLESDEYDA